MGIKQVIVDIVNAAFFNGIVNCELKIQIMLLLDVISDDKAT